MTEKIKEDSGMVRVLSASRLRTVMKLNIAGGAMGMLWCLANAPQTIFNVFFMNHLGGSAAELGLLVAMISSTSLLNLAAIFIFTYFTNRKKIWICAFLMHRILSFVMAGVALHAAHNGNRDLAVLIVLISVPISWAFMNATTSGWWSWVSDIIPDKKRAAFFGRRSSIIMALGMVWFFLITVVLDLLREEHLFYGFAVIFVLSGLLGVADVLLHILIPDPIKKSRVKPVGFENLLAPLKDRNFLGYSIAVGISLFSVNFFAPFAAPYITAKDGIGAPNTILGVMTVITQLAWVATAGPWGLVMDRFGRKPVVILGSLFPMAWIGYLFLSTGNYIIILPMIALISGLLAPAFWEGTNQLMLSLTPEKNRTVFVAWYLTIIGITSAGGPVLGGFVAELLRRNHSTMLEKLTLNEFQILTIIALILIVLSFFSLRGVREGKQKSTGFVISRLATPSIFRTFMNIQALGGTSTSGRVVRALRTIEGASGEIATNDVVERLNDPDQEVREEAAHALGRIGSHDAVDALIEQLRDDSSTIRSDSARALGKIGDFRAIPAIIENMNGTSEEVQAACVEALGAIGGKESVYTLLRIFKEERSDRVKVQGAEAVARLGILEAAWEILPLMQRTTNRVLRRQLASAIGNLFGGQGEFYRYITGDTNQMESRIRQMMNEAGRSIGNLTTHLFMKSKSLSFNKRRAFDLFKEARSFFDDEDYGPTIEKLLSLANLLVEYMAGKPKNHDEALDYCLRTDLKLTLGYWLLRETVQKPDLVRTDETMRLDSLLGFYFLKSLNREWRQFSF